ncbi:MAG: SHOCT domain-containing protein [Methanobacterium sp.]
MPSNKEISEILRAKREERSKIEESPDYVSVTGYGHHLIMGPEGIKMGNSLIPFKKINGIYTEKDNSIRGVKLKLMVNGGTIKIKDVNQKEADKFIIAVRKKLEELEEEKIENTSEISPMDEIKKAKELLDIGALNEEEFIKIKEKYLKKI